MRRELREPLCAINTMPLALDRGRALAMTCGCELKEVIPMLYVVITYCIVFICTM